MKRKYNRRPTLREKAMLDEIREVLQNPTTSGIPKFQYVMKVQHNERRSK